MSYVAIPSNLKHINSISLELMSSDEITNMSFGEVLTSETINYRTGAPQMNGLFCQAIFGPVKNWECACGKYKRYRYAGVICDKCGVEVTHSQVRRERMGHISLAAPCAHPWMFRIIPSRIATILDMKTTDISKIIYFSAYVITDVNQDMLDDYLSRIEGEADSRIKQLESDYDKKFAELSKQYQVDMAHSSQDKAALKDKYEADKELLKNQKSEKLQKISAIKDLAKKELASLNFKDVITELTYQELSQKFGAVFKAQIGAEAIETLLKRVDLSVVQSEVEEKMMTARGETKKKLVKRLRLIKHFVTNNTKPEWMILHRVMVLPPELRPMLQLDGGRFATSDLNELYRRLINRNNRLRKLIQIGAPEVILRNEKRMLQEAVEALIDNSSRGGKQVMANSSVRRPLKSLTDILKGKQGRFRQNLLGKRVDYSGRSVIVVGPKLKLDECGIPKEMAVELFSPFLIGAIIKKSEEGSLSEDDQSYNVHSARRLIEDKHPIIYDILEEIIKDKYVLLNRAPTLHKLSFIAFKPTLIEGRAIQLHPLTCTAFNADFDGDQMAVHLPITLKGQQEAKDLMVSTKNLLKPATGELIMSGKQDIILGGYYLTSVTKDVEEKDMKIFPTLGEVLAAHNAGHVELGELVVTRVKNREKGVKETIKTTPGRILFNQAFPKDWEFYNVSVDKSEFDQILNDAYHKMGPDEMAKVLDNVKDIAFKYATVSGITLSAYDMEIPDGKEPLLADARNKVTEIQSLFDLGLMTENDRYNQVVGVWSNTGNNITELVKERVKPLSNVGLMINSGSRGNISQLNQMAGMKGLSVAANGKVMELPAQHGFVEGLTSLEYFVTTKGARKAQADISLKTADSGYLTRRLVDVAQNLIITIEEDDAIIGKTITRDKSIKMNKSVWDRVYGRYLFKDVEHDGKIVAKKDDLVDYEMYQKYKDIDIQEVCIYSINKSRITKGVSQKAYGSDFSNHKPVSLGTAVGIVAAQSLGEPSTQLTMRSKHTGGVLSKSDITSGLPRVEEIFEARVPKSTSPIADFNGTVEKIEGDLDMGFVITISRENKPLALEYNGEKNILLVESGKSVKSGEAVMVSESGEAVLSNIPGVVESEGDSLVIKNDEIYIQEYHINPGMKPTVKKGEKVTRADALAEGHLNLQELLDKAGIDTLEEYIIQELTAIYSSNGIDVNEKHIEVIIRQMCNKVQIIDPGESEYTIGDMVPYPVVIKKNEELAGEGKKIVVFKRAVNGISKASLSTDSFLSAASFQETSRVLVEAVLSGRKDNLTGLKENVILGQLIPAGTGYTQDRIDAKTVEDDFES